MKFKNTALLMLLLNLFFLTSSCITDSSNLKCSEKTFSLKRIIIKNKILTVEIARTKKQREKGLMGRMALKNNRGMLFVYKTEKKPAFWMKNTSIPLSIGFFDSNKRLLEIRKMQPNSTELIIPKQKIKYALEVNQGWFKKNNIKPGTYFNFIGYEK